MPWTYLQVEVAADDLLVRPLLGPAGLTRDQAVAEVQVLLDRSPVPAVVAETWRRGAKDDTVVFGPFVWTIIEYDDDPNAAAMAWLEDYAATIRAAGLDVQVARWPGPS